MYKVSSFSFDSSITTGFEINSYRASLLIVLRVVYVTVQLGSGKTMVSISLAEINLTKPKNNLPPAKREALKTLKGDEQINLKKADKGTNTVVMSKQDKLNEGQIQLNVKGIPIYRSRCPPTYRSRGS